MSPLSSTRSRLTAAIPMLLWCLAIPTPALAQLAGPVPEPLQEVGVTEHLDAVLPLDMQLVDDAGRTVRLGDYFDGKRPVILTLNYYRCAMLCNLQLNGFVEGLKGLGWTPGQEFEVVTVSINPRETPTLARMKKQSYLTELERPSAAAGWHFTTAREAEIRRLTETVGFRYTYDPREDQYAHAAALMVVTPDGRVARYLYGIEYPPRDLRLALLEASRGEIGSPWDQVLLFCFHYDPSSRQYAPVAMNIMRLGGGVTVVALGSALGLLWARDLRRKKSRDA